LGRGRIAQEEAEKYRHFLPKIGETKCSRNHELQFCESVYSGYYGCDVCGFGGVDYAYHCDECGYDAHPRCAIPKFEESVAARWKLAYALRKQVKAVIEHLPNLSTQFAELELVQDFDENENYYRCKVCDKDGYRERYRSQSDGTYVVHPRCACPEVFKQQYPLFEKLVLRGLPLEQTDIDVHNHTLTRATRASPTANAYSLCSEPLGNIIYCCSTCDYAGHPHCSLSDITSYQVTANTYRALMIENKLPSLIKEHERHYCYEGLPLYKMPWSGGGTYQCDLCYEYGTFLSYRCASCNFDAHPSCILGATEFSKLCDSVNEAEVFEAQAALILEDSYLPYYISLTHSNCNQELYRTYRETYSCKLCDTEGKGVVYACWSCDFNAHPQCIHADFYTKEFKSAFEAKYIKLAPEKHDCRYHSHTLEKSESGGFTCDICWNHGEGDLYSCSEGCNYTCHFPCALGPRLNPEITFIEETKDMESEREIGERDIVKEEESNGEADEEDGARDGEKNENVNEEGEGSVVDQNDVIVEETPAADEEDTENDDVVEATTNPMRLSLEVGNESD
jgi:hypothetical protein